MLCLWDHANNLPFLWSWPYLPVIQSLKPPSISRVPRPCGFPLPLCPPITSFCNKTPFPKASSPSRSAWRGGEEHRCPFLPAVCSQRSPRPCRSCSEAQPLREPPAAVPRAPSPAGPAQGSIICRAQGSIICWPCPGLHHLPAVPRAPSAGHGPHGLDPAVAVSPSLLHPLTSSSPSHGTVTATQKLSKSQQLWEINAFTGRKC